MRLLSQLTQTYVTVALLSVALTAAAQEPGTASGEWPSYGGDLTHNRYSPLDQITAQNFSELELAWRFSTDNLGPRPETNFQSTPLMVNGILYTTAGSRRAAVALDAETGEMLWMHRVDEGERGEEAPRQLSGRGLAYWDDGGDGVILYVTPGYQLVALSAGTGARIQSFGNAGIVDLKQNIDQDLEPTSEIGLHAAPVVAGNTIIIGAAHRPGGAPSSRTNVKGFVRGFDVRTGDRKWIFHTIPDPGEFGNDTWLNDSWRYTGNTGSWAQMTIDPELNMAYFAVEAPTGDYYGGHRQGDNLFSGSVVAVDLDTGERIWHYQTVHHDIWDWDLPAAPVLLDITVDGREIKALIQPTKQSYMFVLDRVTGEPVWPISEIPVTQGDVPGEWYAPTQPIPTRPPPRRRDRPRRRRPGRLHTSASGGSPGNLLQIHDRMAVRPAHRGHRRGDARHSPATQLDRRRKLARRIGRPRDRLLLYLHKDPGRRAGVDQRPGPLRHGLHSWPPRRRQRERCLDEHPGIPDDQAAMGSHHRHQHEHRRHRVADSARRGAGQHPEP